MDILNLGAGAAPLPNAINLDIAKLPGIQVVHDLNSLPWPFAISAFDMVIARSVFEHLDITLVEALDECWRVLRPGGRLEVKLPYWNHDRCWADPTHRRGFSLGVFDYFDPATEAGRVYDHYTPRKWKIHWQDYTSGSRSSIGAKMEAVK